LDLYISSVGSTVYLVLQPVNEMSLIDCSTGNNVSGAALISEMMLTETYNFILHHLSAHTRVALTSTYPAYGPESKDVTMDYTKAAQKYGAKQDETLEEAMGRFLTNLSQAYLDDPTILTDVKVAKITQLGDPQTLGALLFGQLPNAGTAPAAALGNGGGQAPLGAGTGRSTAEDANLQDRADKAEAYANVRRHEHLALNVIFGRLGLGRAGNPDEPFGPNAADEVDRAIRDAINKATAGAVNAANVVDKAEVKKRVEALEAEVAALKAGALGRLDKAKVLAALDELKKLYTPAK